MNNAEQNNNITVSKIRRSQVKLPLFVLALLLPAQALAQGFGPVVRTTAPTAGVLIAIVLSLFLPWQISRLAGGSPLVRSMGALLLAAALAVAGAPPHVAGAAALIVMCLRVGRARVAAVAGIAVWLSASMPLAEALADVDVVVTSSLLALMGFAPVVDGTAILLAAGTILVDPACAAVEATLMGLVMSLCLRSLAAESTTRIFCLAGLHTVTVVLANLVRIVAVAIAMDSSADLAQQVHTTGGLVLVLVHVPFLAGPMRSLFRQWRATAPTASTKLQSSALAATALLVAVFSPAVHARDAYYPIAGDNVDSIDRRVADEFVLQRAQRLGFRIELRATDEGEDEGEGSLSQHTAAAVAALKAAGPGRVLSGFLRTADSDEHPLKLEIFIANETGTVLSSVKVLMTASDDKQAIGSAVTKALKMADAAAAKAPVLEQAAADAPTPLAPPVAAAAVAAVAASAVAASAVAASAVAASAVVAPTLTAPTVVAPAFVAPAVVAPAFVAPAFVAPAVFAPTTTVAGLAAAGEAAPQDAETPSAEADLQSTGLVAEEEAPSPPATPGTSIMLPASLAVGALVAAGGAIGAGLWASGDVGSLKNGTATDRDGARNFAAAKALTSDLLTMTAVGLAVGACVFGAMSLLAPAVGESV